MSGYTMFFLMGVTNGIEDIKDIKIKKKEGPKGKKFVIKCTMRTGKKLNFDICVDWNTSLFELQMKLAEHVKNLFNVAMEEIK